MNFGELKTKVSEYLNRSDLDSHISDWIHIAQRDVERGQFTIEGRTIAVNWNCMKSRQTVDSDEMYITMPVRIKEVCWMKILHNGRYYPLDGIAPDLALSLYPYPESANGRPKLFSFLEEQNEIMVRPTPDQSYHYEMELYAYSAELSKDADENWWTKNAWEILLYGALIQAEAFMVNDSRMTTWKTMYDLTVSKLASTERSARFASSQFVIQSYLPIQLRSGGSDFNFEAGE